MKTLKAIETNYAGCRFRSRLEARWAVFFDSIGTPWQYEPQGYTVGPDATPYLPDFWLPELELWVEVKGVLKPEEFRTALYACSSVGLPTTPVDSRCDPEDVWPWRGRMLLLGDVPDDDGDAHTTFRIDSVAGELLAIREVVFRPGRDGWFAFEVGHSYPANQFLLPGVEQDNIQAFLAGRRCPWVVEHPRVRAARRAARSARFEHGESGAA